MVQRIKGLRCVHVNMAGTVYILYMRKKKDSIVKTVKGEWIKMGVPWEESCRAGV